MKQDTIEIEILEDGTIKTTTDRVSMPNHQNAESFLRDIGRLCGGVIKRMRRVMLGHSLQSSLDAHAHDGHTHSH